MSKPPIYKDESAKQALTRLFGGMWPQVLGEIAVSNRAQVLITMPVDIINVGSKRDDNHDVIDYGAWLRMGNSRIFVPWRLIHAFEPWSIDIHDPTD